MSTGLTPRTPTPKEFPPHPTIKAAAITTKDRRGTLLLVADYAKYGQYQPPQAAFNNIQFLVPAPSDAHPYLITPGGVRAINGRREAGGIRVTLEDFGVSAIILVTTNVDLKDQIERSITRSGRLPSGWRSSRRSCSAAGSGTSTRSSRTSATPRRRPPPCSTGPAS